MPGHHHECHVGSIGHARKVKGQTNAPQSPATKAQSEHVQPHAAWVGVGCVGEWRRGEDRGVCAGVDSHSPDFDMSDMVWLYAVGGLQVHPLTDALHEV